MKYRKLKLEDCNLYRDDILECYNNCHLIFDSQNYIPRNYDLVNFLSTYIQAEDAYVLGIFNDTEQFLYGLVIFDNIRIADKSCAEVHIVTSRIIWGKKIRDVYKNILKGCIFDTIYCQIPKIATNAIAICKLLKFKKTGYIPNALPYVNSRGEEKMYDIQIYTYVRDKVKD